jgi:kynurenine formamidase
VATDDKSDIRTTLVPALISRTGLPIASVNYRLSLRDPNAASATHQHYRHPTHVLDVIDALNLLTGPKLVDAEAERECWDRNRLFLVGKVPRLSLVGSVVLTRFSCSHSCAAMMISSLVLVPPSPSTTTSLAAPSFTVPSTLWKRIAGLVCVDGIYSLTELLREYGDYRDFVSGAFGDDEQVYERESVTGWVLPPPDDQGGPKSSLRCLILHSREDDLLSVRQSQLFASHLGRLFSGEVGDLGEQATEYGEQAPVRKVTSNKRVGGDVEVDFESLKGDHYEVLHSAFLPNRIQEWLGQ